MISNWGGLASLGLYELASRLVVQSRSLIIAATQPLIAVFANIKHGDTEKLGDLLESSICAVMWASVAAALFLVIGAPTVGWFTLGNQNTGFLFSAFALIIGWNMNALSTPFYYAALGHGIMKWNLISHITLAIIMVMLGIPLGAIFGVPGIITLWGNTIALKLSFVWGNLVRPISVCVVIIFIVSALGAVVIPPKKHWVHK